MMIVRGMTRMHDDNDDGVECHDDGTAADADDYGGAMMMIKVYNFSHVLSSSVNRAHW